MGIDSLDNREDTKKAAGGWMRLGEKEYRTIVAVVEAGSFSRAAAALDTCQSNVSIRIRNVEEDLEAALFERGLRGIVLTPKGEMLYRHAKVVLASLDKHEQDLVVLLSA
jgi:DNA-binding transcriptional LysR family regulator